MTKKISDGIKTDRRAKLRAAAAKVKQSMSSRFRRMAADDIVAFLRADEPAKRVKLRDGR